MRLKMCYTRFQIIRTNYEWTLSGRTAIEHCTHPEDIITTEFKFAPFSSFPNHMKLSKKIDSNQSSCHFGINCSPGMSVATGTNIAIAISPNHPSADHLRKWFNANKEKIKAKIIQKFCYLSYWVQNLVVLPRFILEVQLSDPMDSINAKLFGRMAEDYLGCTEDKIYEAAKQIIPLQNSIINIKPLTQEQEAALSQELTGAELSQTSTSDLEKT